MKRISRPVLLGLLLTICIVADAAHITDKLLAGLYPEPATKGQPIKLLSSGTAVEVLEKRQVFHRVRLADGVEGWVNSAYLTDEKPAKTLLLEARARIEQLEKRLQEAQDKPNLAPDCPEPLETRKTSVDTPSSVAEQPVAGPPTAGPAPAVDCSAVTGGLQSELVALRGRVSNAVAMLAVDQESDGTVEHDGFAFDDLKDWRRYWYVYAVPIALLLGLAIGIALMDYRIRKRFGGVRI